MIHMSSFYRDPNPLDKMDIQKCINSAVDEVNSLGTKLLLSGKRKIMSVAMFYLRSCYLLSAIIILFI